MNKWENITGEQMIEDLEKAAESLLEDELTEEQKIWRDMRKLTPAQRLEEKMALKAYAKKAKRAHRNQENLRKHLAKQGLIVKFPGDKPAEPVHVPHVATPVKKAP